VLLVQLCPEHIRHQSQKLRFNSSPAIRSFRGTRCVFSPSKIHPIEKKKKKAPLRAKRRILLTCCFLQPSTVQGVEMTSTYSYHSEVTTSPTDCFTSFLTCAKIFNLLKINIIFLTRVYTSRVLFCTSRDMIQTVQGRFSIIAPVSSVGAAHTKQPGLLLTGFRLLSQYWGRENGVLFSRGCISLKNRSYRPLLRDSTSPFKRTCLLIRIKEDLSGLYRRNGQC
jgi:hypothetical protein